MNPGRGLVVLVVLAALLVGHIGFPLVGLALLPLVVSLLAAHIDRHGGELARAMVASASRLLPPDKREDQRDEWLDHVETAGEHGVLPLTRALSIALIAAPLLAVGLRIGRRQRQA